MFINGSDSRYEPPGPSPSSSSKQAVDSGSSEESIDELLQRVLRIQAEYADRPVHSYDELVHLIRTWSVPYTIHVPNPSYRVLTSNLDSVSRCMNDALSRLPTKYSDLKPFTRAGPLEKIYAQEFLPRLKQEYGSTADYLLKRLDWTPELIAEAQSTGRYFTRDIEDKYLRVRKNDWAYSVPKEYE